MNSSLTQDEKLDKLREILKSADVCMLTTVDENGDLHSRPMANPRNTDFDGELWFFTSAGSPKVDEINRLPKVNVCFADIPGKKYASLTGYAELTQDRAKIKELWLPSQRLWFPEGIDTPDIALLKVTVDRAEYWDGTQSMLVHAFEIVTALLQGSQPHLTENEQVRLHKH